MLQPLPDQHVQTVGTAPACSWDEYLGRIRQAARGIARSRPVEDGFLLFPQSLPEYRPDYLGEVVAAAMLDELEHRPIDQDTWDRWRRDIQALIAQVLDWPGGDRVRATALVATKHGLGLEFGRNDDASGDVLGEAVADLHAPSDGTFSVSRPTAVQLRFGRNRLGLVFLTGYEDGARISSAQAVLDQAGDLSLATSLRHLIGHRRFWIGTVSNGVSRLRRRSPGDFARSLKGDAKAALAAGVRACLAQQLRRSGAAKLTDNGGAVADTPIPVLMYHRVADDGDPGLARYRVTPVQFEQQMEWLKQNSFTPLSLDLLKAARQGDGQLPRRPVLITFDDGYCDFYDHAWPVLRKLAFSSLMFVVAGKVGDRSDWDQAFGRAEPLMSWRQLSEISAGGVTIGSHSLMHRRFSRLDVRESRDDMQASAEIIGRALGQRPIAFCYPYGVYDRLVERLLPTCGYEFAFTCDPAAATLQNNPLRLPRIEIMGSDDLRSFAAKVEAWAA
jgi:peptidoglycan/xylan/chitin deacetylase (PgdA/CDA1 family)